MLYFEVHCILLLVWLFSMTHRGCLMFSECSSLKWTSWESDKHHACAPFLVSAGMRPSLWLSACTRYYTLLSPPRADTRGLAGPHAELPNRGFILNPFKNLLNHIHNVHKMKTLTSYLTKCAKIRYDQHQRNILCKCVFSNRRTFLK